jgi:hypothetical protein
MSAFIDSLPQSILRDWMQSALGKKIGEGIGRQVFVYGLNPQFVVKVEQSGFQNIVEHELWEVVKDTSFKKWFAPVRDISGLGTILLMERTLPALRKAYPKHMPQFLGDYKYSNYGLLRGRLVCHDYGSMVIATNGINGAMRKADWWGLNDGSSFNDVVQA